VDEKRKQILTKYMGDMRAVVTHTKTALGRQREEFGDRPEIVERIADMESELDEQLERMIPELERLGGSPTAPVKEAVANVAGAIAGAYDKVRSEAVSKALRDDLVAMSMCYISWSMLHTTAAALAEPAVAQISERGMHECARAVMTLDELIPGEVERDLRDSGIPLEEGAARWTATVSTEAWAREQARAKSDAGQAGTIVP